MTEITIDAKAFKQALDVIGGSTNDRVRAGNTCLLHVFDNAVTVIGESFSTLARATCFGNGDYNETLNALQIDYTRLSGIVGAGSGICTLETDNRSLAVTTGGTTARLSVFPDPTVPNWKETTPVAYVAMDEFRDALNFVAPSVAPGSLGNHKMTGIVVGRCGGDLCLAATDGTTASFTEIDCDFPSDDLGLHAIVPANDLKAAIGALNGTREQLNIRIADGVIEFRTDIDPIYENAWSIRQIDGKFPDIVALKPSPLEITTTFSVARTDLLRSLKLAGLFASANAGVADVVVINATSSVIVVSNKGSEQGSVNDEIEFVDSNLEPICFMVAGKHLQKIVGAWKGDTVRFSLISPDKTIMLDVGDPERAFQLITPCVPAVMG